MASVQELLAAAESANQTHRPFKPLADLLDAGLQGYQAGQQIKQRRTELMAKVLKLKQEQDAAAAQAEMRKQAEADLGLKQDANLKNAVRTAGVTPPPTLPVQKFEREWSQDEKGNYSRKFKTVEPKTPKTLEEIMAGQVQAGTLPLADAIKMRASESRVAPRSTESPDLAAKRRWAYSTIAKYQTLSTPNKVDKYTGKMIPPVIPPDLELDYQKARDFVRIDEGGGGPSTPPPVTAPDAATEYLSNLSKQRGKTYAPTPANIEWAKKRIAAGL